MGIGRRVLPIILACSLGLPIALGTPAPAPASAACAYTWTSLITDSASGTNGRFSFTSTVKYKLEFNTCNLGVYTRIYVDTYTDKFTITGDTFGWTYVTDNSAVLKDCNGLTDGCIVYPGQVVPGSVDNRWLAHTGNGSITRISSPHVTYTYSRYSAIADRLRFADGGVLFVIRYQFIRDVIYDG